MKNLKARHYCREDNIAVADRVIKAWREEGCGGKKSFILAMAIAFLNRIAANPEKFGITDLKSLGGDSSPMVYHYCCQVVLDGKITDMEIKAVNITNPEYKMEHWGHDHVMFYGVHAQRLYGYFQEFSSEQSAEGLRELVDQFKSNHVAVIQAFLDKE